jgi:xanthine dehydrogenase accessory factor
MTVTIASDTEHLRLDGDDYWFCSPGCHASFAAEKVDR